MTEHLATSMPPPESSSPFQRPHFFRYSPLAGRNFFAFTDASSRSTAKKQGHRMERLLLELAPGPRPHERGGVGKEAVMTNILVKRGGEIAPSVARQEWDPFRWTRSMLGWDPFRGMALAWPEESSFIPAFDVKETKEGFNFKADVPGIKDKDIDVSLTGNRLTVRGKREEEKEEKTETYYTSERTYGTFTRSFTLPDGCDSAKVMAELKDGVLTLFVPKRPEAQSRRIAVKSEPAR
jgi:HSP20 family protein